MPNFFELGQLVATPAALRLLTESAVDVHGLLSRRLTMEAGVLSPDDQAANRRAVNDGSRILSAFDIGGEKVYVITESADDQGRRYATTILLASEY